MLSDDQWNTAKNLFCDYAIRFFPGKNDMVPQFVPLDDDVKFQMIDLLADLHAVSEPPPAKKPRFDDPLPPAAAAAAASAMSDGRSRKDKMAIDMDGEQNEEEPDIMEDDHDIKWEVEAWFDRAHGARFLKWDNNESQPRVQWLQLQSTFPRLSMLARRFLCILPYSAPSERVWSGFGHIIDKSSITIYSTLAAQIMFLRANKDILDFIPV